ncbi:MAG: GNAT family N-acetyltransferase [Lachnospiraceae bacterium]|jgi:GNAT superfamily N-acetyltransferase|nr:GNAT family N-acetyltransferase [uncultured Acetatifactor sp.]MCI9232524.1 GNAT family N-acetyltransferase [Lachnospiraceae bacterium]MCI9571445.1 GNAT family N-acetyltransferase [Lachnospiraceae bacterium]
MGSIRFELAENVLKAEDFIRLKVATGFLERPLPQVEKALENGLFNVSAICDGKVVGMGRLVGDGAMYWYLQEIIVLPEYQGKGIGKSIVERLLEHIERTAVPGTKVDVGLTAVAGKEPFYEKFGFHSSPTGMRKTVEINTPY